jgi:hypothetical protein
MTPSRQGTFFDSRFLGLYAGPIMSDPTIALVELVANSWDAYATEVDITWPDRETGDVFQILDNGIGMTPEEFEQRWRTIYYDRASRQGLTVKAPPEIPNGPERHVYGRNGKGRTAGFQFSPSYRVRTWRDGHEATFLVEQGVSDPIDPKLEKERDEVEGHGTQISGIDSGRILMSAEQARSALSTRFLSDPAFSVSVNGVQVTFNDVPIECLVEMDVAIPDFGTAHIHVIDSLTSDRTAKQHGIAWWVNRRLVGQIGWRGSDHEKIVDGRTEEAKRFTFIVQADFLENSIEADWSDFKDHDAAWTATQPLVQSAVQEKFGLFTAERRAETTAYVRNTYRHQVEAMPLASRSRWEKFLDQVVMQCPGIGERQITQLMGILATLETSQSQYAILEKLHNFKSDEFDKWNSVLESWTVHAAKIALDVIRDRLRLIEEIRARAADSNSNEVQQLQPLFKSGLWIFGPQFEAIEFTSNQAMNSVVKKIYGKEMTTSNNRPDFAVTPDSTVGCYSMPAWDKDFVERGTATLVIVELKRPGVQIGSDEKAQVWKYVRELKELGLVTGSTNVIGFVLGDRIHPQEQEDRTEGPNVRIQPMLYNEFVNRAQARMLTLHAKLIDSPMMKSAIEDFAKVPVVPVQTSLQLAVEPKRGKKSKAPPPPHAKGLEAAASL